MTLSVLVSPRSQALVECNRVPPQMNLCFHTSFYSRKNKNSGIIWETGSCQLAFVSVFFSESKQSVFISVYTSFHDPYTVTQLTLAGSDEVSTKKMIPQKHVATNLSHPYFYIQGVFVAETATSSYV